jgi:hypothetical protein|tara:strand:- start:404 stop:607 length:204 start_codon:yes stop_codon:yes gene_type:complete
MSIRYIQSLRYHVKQCDWLLANIGTMIPSQDEECQEAIDFLQDLKLGYERDIADVSAGMARQEARVV